MIAMSHQTEDKNQGRLKILFSNLGYARGIDGSLQQHISRFFRNFYHSVNLQKQVLAEFKALVAEADPDLCCLVEIDQGSPHSSYFNQLHALVDDTYPFYDIADKYGEKSFLRRMPLHIGKSNAFLSKQNYDFQRLYFRFGTKRLVYHLQPYPGLHIYFAHFSLLKKTRFRQFEEVNAMIRNIEGDVVILADFNVTQGFSELQPLLEGTRLHIVNKPNEHTFMFHRRQLALDLCLCSRNLLPRLNLKIVDQPFSDHDALLVSIEPQELQP